MSHSKSWREFLDLQPIPHHVFVATSRVQCFQEIHVIEIVYLIVGVSRRKIFPVDINSCDFAKFRCVVDSRIPIDRIFVFHGYSSYRFGRECE